MTMTFGIDSHGGEREGEGNSTYTGNLIRALLALGGEETFALLAGDPGHAFYRSLEATGSFRVRAVLQWQGVARIVWSLARAAARERVDCLHVQYFAPLRHPGPLVVTVHDLGFLHVPASFPPGLRMVMRAVVPWSLRRADRIITVSEFVRQDLLGRYPALRDKVRVVPNGVGPEFRPLEPAETRRVLSRYGLEPGFVFSLGRLNRRKNLERLFRACSALRWKPGGDVALIIGGKADHGFEEVIRAATATATPGAIRWVGLIPDHDLPAFYAGAACFVYPSLFEGFGLPVLEAMASGCPVVSSNRAALPEVVGDAGLLVDPESVDSIAAGLEQVLVDRSLGAELRQRGLARSRRFTWHDTAARTLAVLRDAAGARRP